MKKKDETLISRIDAVLMLLLLVLETKDSKPELSTLFYRFKKLGLSNKDIAKITGKNPSQVAKIAYEFKRKRKSKK